MKNIYLIFSIIITTIKKNAFICFTLFIGILACNTMFIYMYGLICQSMEKDGMPDYYIYYETGPLFGIKDIAKKLKDYRLNVDYYAIPNAENCCFGDIDRAPDATRFLIRAREDVSSFLTIKGKAANLSKENTVLIPEEFGFLGVGDHLTLNGVKYEVAGVASAYFFMMSAKTFDESGLKPSMISIDAPLYMSDHFQKELKSAFGTGYHVEKNPNSGYDSGVKSDIAIVGIIFLLSAFSFMYLMAYIYEQSAYEYAVYEMAGATRGRIIFLLGSVMFIVLGIASLCAQTLHRLFYHHFFSKMNIYRDFIFKPKDYAAIFCITLFSVYIFILGYIILRTKKSSVLNIRKFTV